jgi:hypothetical protein
VKSAVRSWINTALNSAIAAEDVSVWMTVGKRGPVQNPIPVTLGIIIVHLA